MLKYTEEDNGLEYGGKGGQVEVGVERLFGLLGLAGGQIHLDGRRNGFGLFVFGARPVVGMRERVVRVAVLAVDQFVLQLFDQVVDNAFY